MILTLIIHEATLRILSERLAKGPYLKNTLPAVGLEPMIFRLQIRASNQLSYPGFMLNCNW